jgi:hypothetical protein
MITNFLSGNVFAAVAIASPLREADADDHVVPLARERRHVRDVVGGGARLDDAALDPELLLRALQPLVRELVEAAVVELARIRDQRDLEGLLAAGRRRGGGLVVAAARGEREARARREVR